MVTRLYFHSANSTVSGTLPSTSQSVLTADIRADDQTVNRSMNTTIGISQTSVSVVSSTVSGATVTYYMTRFVSPLINQTSITSGAWTVAFAAKPDFDRNNYPVSGTNRPIKINCYVWKPSDGTKYGTILDGNTASTVDHYSGGDEVWQKVNFTGSTVSGLTAADAVIILEIWFVCTIGTSAGGSNYYYFDGTNNSTDDGSLVASAASYLETSQIISFIGNLVSVAPSSQTVSVSDNAARTVVRQTRNMSLTEALSISDLVEANASTIPDNIEIALAVESVTIGDGVSYTITRHIPLNIERVMDGEDLKISDFAECHFESGTIIYTGDPSYFVA